MKIDRLLGITIYLLNHGRTSSQALAERFEVSKRTIIRDMDVLSLAGIPIASNCGVDGGYEILETFEMGSQIASGIDYSYIVSALEALASAYTNKEIEATLEKVNALAKGADHTVIMDLSVVHEQSMTNETLFILNQLIQKKHVITFEYTNNRDECKQVFVEPVATIYKWYNWYLIGYSKKHEDYCLYKVVRMRQVQGTEEENKKVHVIKEVQERLEASQNQRKYIQVQLHCKARLQSKCQEYLNGTITKVYENGDFDYEFKALEEETLWHAILFSFGEDVKVIAPEALITRMLDDCSKIMAVYQK